MTDFHSRGARPAQRTRTPSSCISSRRRRITSRLKPMRNFTSSGERDQFSVEKAYAEIAFTPISIAPSTTSNSECSPCSWPTVRGSPRCLAHRPLPSITIATWRGTSSRGTAGGRAPDGWGVGGRTSRVTPDRLPDRRRPRRPRRSANGALSPAILLSTIGGTPPGGRRERARAPRRRTRRWTGCSFTDAPDPRALQGMFALLIVLDVTILRARRTADRDRLAAGLGRHRHARHVRPRRGAPLGPDAAVGGRGAAAARHGWRSACNGSATPPPRARLFIVLPAFWLARIFGRAGWAGRARRRRCSS